MLSSRISHISRKNENYGLLSLKSVLAVMIARSCPMHVYDRTLGGIETAKVRGIVLLEQDNMKQSSPRHGRSCGDVLVQDSRKDGWGLDAMIHYSSALEGCLEALRRRLQLSIISVIGQQATCVLASTRLIYRRGIPTEGSCV